MLWADRHVEAHAIGRVFCVDGPCRGMQFVDLDTGRVVFDQSAAHVYRVHDTETISTDFGPCRAAYFDRTEPP
jgi:hypothetical protein